MDALPAAPCDSPATWSGLADGPHSFHVRSVDRGSAIRSAETSRSWSIDTAAPDTSITSATATEVRFASVPAVAGDRFECRLDGGTWQGCTSPRAIPALPDGAHSFDVRAIDAAGNVDLTAATRAWTVDTVAPDTTITAGPTGRVASQTAQLSFTSTEPGSRFTCSRDGGSWTACSSPVTYSKLSNGTRGVRVRATDAAGNTDPTPAERKWTVDVQGPSTTLLGPADGSTVGGTIGAAATASDSAGVKSVEFLVDGVVKVTDTSVPYTFGAAGRLDTRPLTPGPHVIAARATDKVGNVGVHSARVVVDQAAATPDTVLFNGSFDTGDLSQWSARSVFAGDRAVAATSPVQAGKYSARFLVQPGDVVGGQTGAELSATPDASGSDRYYGWSTMLPSTYPLDGGYQTLASWFASGQRLVEVRVAGSKVMVLARTPAGTIRTLWSASIALGRWHRFVVRSRWAASGGLLELWYDGALVYAPAVQPTLLSDTAPATLRIGLVRDPAITSTQMLYHDSVRVGTTYEAVR
jgi:hypothetical protein